MAEKELPAYYRVKRGQTLRMIAETFSLPPHCLARRNALSEEPEEGRILLIPARESNLYVVRGGESKTQLCGSPSRYEEINGTAALYPAQTVLL
ncbi:MAG: hypothetical protein ACI4NG_04760 [Candidatus Gallimonas sp.]